MLTLALFYVDMNVQSTFIGDVAVHHLHVEDDVQCAQCPDSVHIHDSLSDTDDTVIPATPPSLLPVPDQAAFSLRRQLDFGDNAIIKAPSAPARAPPLAREFVQNGSLDDALLFPPIRWEIYPPRL